MISERKHQVYVQCCGSSRKTIVTVGREWMSVDFGLPVGIKIRIKQWDIPIPHQVAIHAAVEMEKLGKRRRKAVVDYIQANSPSTEERRWCEQLGRHERPSYLNCDLSRGQPS